MAMEIKKTDQYEKWFRSLKDDNAKGRINIRITRLSLGNPGDVKSVGEGISELRIDYGPGYRVYFTMQGNTLILLLIGGDKSSQTKDIEKAKLIAQEY